MRSSTPCHILSFYNILYIILPNYMYLTNKPPARDIFKAIHLPYKCASEPLLRCVGLILHLRVHAPWIMNAITFYSNLLSLLQERCCVVFVYTFEIHFTTQSSSSYNIRHHACMLPSHPIFLHPTLIYPFTYLQLNY